jgi:hypothetical protein
MPVGHCCCIPTTFVQPQSSPTLRHRGDFVVTFAKEYAHAVEAKVCGDHATFQHRRTAVIRPAPSPSITCFAASTSTPTSSGQLCFSGFGAGVGAQDGDACAYIAQDHVFSISPTPAHQCSESDWCFISATFSGFHWVRHS